MVMRVLTESQNLDHARDADELTLAATYSARNGNRRFVDYVVYPE